MIIEQYPEKVQQYSRSAQRAARSIGFVPTMGFLHAGHLSLVRKARQENDIVAVSIFVNPIQFGPNEDLEKYPRNIEQDCQLLQAEGADVVFLPSAQDMYPAGSATGVAVRQLQNILCGSSRPGHFDGVTTVVAKLFNIVMPNRAYFGLKDYQQYLIVKKMAEDLNFPIEVIGCPIVREPDGLAMSSRNSYLSPRERAQAPAIYGTLRQITEKVRLTPASVQSLRAEFAEQIGSLLDNARIDYFEILDADTLEQVSSATGKMLIATAVFVGTTRLIDNVVVNCD